MPAPAFTPRQSGVLVPTAATLEKAHYTLPQADFVKLKRLMAFAREFEMLAIYVCQRCRAQITLTQHDRLVTTIEGPAGERRNAPGGRLTLSCDCSVPPTRTTCTCCEHPVSATTPAHLQAAMEAHVAYVNATADRATDPHFEDARLDALLP